MSEHSLTVIRCNGFVVQSPPLDPQPWRQVMFGSPSAPLAREFVDVREVDALMKALAPHVHALCEYAGGTDAQRIVDAVASLRSAFEPLAAVERPAPRLVLA